VSKEKKSKKARKPNVPMYTGPIQSTGSGGGGTIEAATATATTRPASVEIIGADYSHTISDLRRIGLLAGLLVAGLVALSFFIQ
jgi:hypothetical protein